MNISLALGVRAAQHSGQVDLAPHVRIGHKWKRVAGLVAATYHQAWWHPPTPAGTKTHAGHSDQLIGYL